MKPAAAPTESDLDQAEVRSELDAMPAIVSRLCPGEGLTKTIIPFLSLYRVSKPTSFTRAVATPALGLLVQGSKVLHIGSKIMRYGPGDYFASLIDMPTAGHVPRATRSAPCLGVRIDFETREFASVMVEAGLKAQAKAECSPAACIGRLDAKLMAALSRLIRLLDVPEDAPFLAPMLKREIIYRLLTGRTGDLFCQKFVLEQRALGVGKAIAWLKENFDQPFRIEHLARLSDMSTSSLHHKFKALTTVGPLQYQKQLRLQEARRLLMSGTMDASTAAVEVGYESPSQFSRDYRRLFGLPPMKDARGMRDQVRTDSRGDLLA